MDALLLALQLLATEVDWRQTRQIAAHPAQYQEENPLLREHPTAGEVNRHFLLYEAAVLGGAAAFPEHRTAILGGSLAVEVVLTQHNKALGLKWRF